MEKFLDYSAIGISTETIIGVSNIQFDILSLFKYLPVTEYQIDDKRRGRKSSVQIDETDYQTESGEIDMNLIRDERFPKGKTTADLEAGDIIMIKYKRNVRGCDIKKTKKFFLNSVTIILRLKEKFVNIKVTNNGKFQITGIKEYQNIVDTMKHLFRHIHEAIKYTNEEFYSLRDGYAVPKIIFNVVMKNKDFKLGFPISRYNLDKFIKTNTDYISFFESSINTGVNIKIKEKYNSENLELSSLLIRIPLDGYSMNDLIHVAKELSVNIKDDNGILKRRCDLVESIKSAFDVRSNEMVYGISHLDYLSLLVDKDREKEMKKNNGHKIHTFLIFQSGSVIFSSSGKNMGSIFDKFVTTLLENRKIFEERLNISAYQQG